MLIAEALEMVGEDFLEYHLYEMRMRLDERLNFQTAAKNFELARAKQFEPAPPRPISAAPVARARRRCAPAS